MLSLVNLIPQVDEPEIPWHSFTFDNPKRNKKLSCTCGDSAAHSNKENPPPWQVLIYSTNSRNSSTSNTIPERICSGTVINDRVILTAASCIMKLPEMRKNKTVDISWFFQNKFKYFYEKIVVAILPSKKTFMKDIEAKQILGVEQYHFSLFHAFQKMAFGKVDVDIALLKLKTALNFDDSQTKLLPLCLPTQYLDKHLLGHDAHLSGWKVYIEFDSIAVPPANNTVFEYLTLAPQKIKPRLHCRVSVAPSFVSETFICIRGESLSEVYDFHSDGAPVMINSKNNPSQFLIIGIHSWSTHLVFGTKPAASLETNISGFLKVIESFSEKAQGQWCNSEPKDKYDEESSETNKEAYLRPYKELKDEWEKINSTIRNKFMLPKSTCSCGILNSETKARIQGGNDAVPYEYGFQVMVIKNNSDGASLCGGTLVNDKIVLTAAHCVHKMQVENSIEVIGDIAPPKHISVRIIRYAGVLKNDNFSMEVDVEYVFSHPMFKGALRTGVNYDVAILILKERIDFNALRFMASPICLPETGEIVGQPGREDAVTLGISFSLFRLTLTNLPGFLADVLQELKVRILSKTKCTENWKQGLHDAEVAFPELVFQDSVLDLTNRICAGTENNVYNYRDVLPGDSGGPLMVPLMSNTSSIKPGAYTNPFIQVGITSIVNAPILLRVYNISSPPSVVIYLSVQGGM
ncbi:unnamed protein product [Orchesella dallaii]|uniref:Peptidase S1 domain-containing protein n=1 Tax=Orchesella dallaii TaxID=48710 RepID=A0ABP1PPF4_9HEXA